MEKTFFVIAGCLMTCKDETIRQDSPLLVFVGLAAIIVWIADWTSSGEGRATALDVLNRRLARGEISRAEYDRKRKLLARW